ncbi:MAG: phenylalanine--tRNA ligase subunit alpha, partial [Candidatus Margulisiibacteriota bacterium]
MLIDKLQKLEALMAKTLAESGSLEEIERLRLEFFGKNGSLTELMKELGKLSPEEKPKAGKLINEVKVKLSALLDERQAMLGQAVLAEKLKSESLDVTLPPAKLPYGHKHPLTKTLEDIQLIFARLGYSIAEGPEIETDYYNFEALNFPSDHPARDLHDTFFMENGFLLRTHTSPVQIRHMEAQEPPLRILVPGRVYRNDEIDA